MNELVLKNNNISKNNFDAIALKTFRFQAENCTVYKKYLTLLNINQERVNNIKEIPFLPISFFKSHKIKSFKGKSDIVFSSSGTTGLNTSKHYVKDKSIYIKNSLNAFVNFYGNPSEYVFLALLPNYLERKGSSLIFMVKELIKNSRIKRNSFFIKNYDLLFKKIIKYNNTNQKVILLGVSYALLDFSEKHKIKLSDNFIIMETGGMKGKSKDITRQELHKKLCHNFSIKNIHSEYGMTELLSQAYSNGNGVFQCPTSMRIFIRDLYDPFCLVENGKSGAINIIDLANYYSCSFIATDDTGIKHNDKSFEVTGRIDNAQIRGCNLLI